jgi:hypothetical protein
MKIEIYINNDELLEMIWEDIKKVQARGYYQINKLLYHLPLLFPLSHIFKVKLKLKFKDLFIYFYH